MNNKKPKFRDLFDLIGEAVENVLKWGFFFGLLVAFVAAAFS